MEFKIPSCCCLIRGLGYLAVLHSYMEVCALIYNAPKHQEFVNRFLKRIPFLLPSVFLPLGLDLAEQINL